jgi:hypothetical protein
MEAAPDSGPRRRRARRLPAVLAATVALITLAACGAPARTQTLANEPDLARNLGGAIPHGFSTAVSEDLARLDAACAAIDPEVASRLPAVTPGGVVRYAAIVDGQCEWVSAGDKARPGPPALIVGILAGSSGGATLDETTTLLEGERSIDRVGDRAAFDPQTRTLYVLGNGRLWYLQLVGREPAVAASTILTALGRALVQSPRAR